MKTEEKGAVMTLIEMVGDIFVKLTLRIVVGGAIAILLFINQLNLKEPLIKSGEFSERSSTILLISIGTLITIILWDIIIGYFRNKSSARNAKYNNLVDEFGHFHVQVHTSIGKQA